MELYRNIRFSKDNITNTVTLSELNKRFWRIPYFRGMITSGIGKFNSDTQGFSINQSNFEMPKLISENSIACIDVYNYMIHHKELSEFIISLGDVIFNEFLVYCVGNMIKYNLAVSKSIASYISIYRYYEYMEFNSK